MFILSSLGLTMGTAFGTLKASTSLVNVDQRNANTLLRPSLWSRADWLDWRPAQRPELTLGWLCLETHETLTHEAFGLTSPHQFGMSLAMEMLIWILTYLFFNVWCCFLFETDYWALKTVPFANSVFIISPVLEDMRLWHFFKLCGCFVCLKYNFCVHTAYLLYITKYIMFALTEEVCALEICHDVSVIYVCLSRAKNHDAFLQSLGSTWSPCWT